MCRTRAKSNKQDYTSLLFLFPISFINLINDIYMTCCDSILFQIQTSLIDHFLSISKTHHFNIYFHNPEMEPITSDILENVNLYSFINAICNYKPLIQKGIISRIPCSLSLHTALTEYNEKIISINTSYYSPLYLRIIAETQIDIQKETLWLMSIYKEIDFSKMTKICIEMLDINISTLNDFITILNTHSYPSLVDVELRIKISSGEYTEYLGILRNIIKIQYKTEIEEAVFQILSAFGDHLQSLTLICESNPNEILTATARHLEKYSFKQLQTLSIRLYTVCEIEKIPMFISSFSKQFLPSLKSLHLSSFKQQDYTGIISYLCEGKGNNFPPLEEILIDNSYMSDGISIPVIMKLFEYHYLQTVTLLKIHNIYFNDFINCVENNNCQHIETILLIIRGMYI
ncbi:hypothetical protein WA158_001704 [Blastocystis sp. Blastoise]